LGDIRSTKKSKKSKLPFWMNITQVSKKGNFDFFGFFFGTDIAQKGNDRQGT
jgi:hypothetical protein